MFRLAIASAFAALALAGVPNAGETPSPAGTKLYIISPLDGATVSSPVTVRFGLSGMGIAPAGIEKENTGHHHLLVDVPLPPVDEPIISDDNYLHFGGGQTETAVDLAPGPHTLQLLPGDRNHIPHHPPVVSDRIAITVR